MLQLRPESKSWVKSAAFLILIRQAIIVFGVMVPIQLFHICRYSCDFFFPKENHTCSRLLKLPLKSGESFLANHMIYFFTLSLPIPSMQPALQQMQLSWTYSPFSQLKRQLSKIRMPVQYPHPLSLVLLYVVSVTWSQLQSENAK